MQRTKLSGNTKGMGVHGEYNEGVKKAEFSKKTTKKPKKKEKGVWVKETETDNGDLVKRSTVLLKVKTKKESMREQKHQSQKRTRQEQQETFEITTGSHFMAKPSLKGVLPSVSRKVKKSKRKLLKLQARLPRKKKKRNGGRRSTK